VLEDKELLEANLSSAHHRASFLAASSSGTALAPLNTGGSSLSCWEGPSFLFRVKSKGPKSEAQRADSRGVVLGEGQLATLHQLRGK